MPLPNLFLVGAPRCGTTSLAHYLGMHEAIVSASVKEPAFHASDLAIPPAVVDRDRYLALFDRGDGIYRMEATPWYLYSEVAARSIAQMSPDARIVIQLRDPCNQIASMHAHHRFVGIEPEPDLARAVFEERPASPHDFRRSVDYRAVASFAPQVERFIECFPPNQIHFVMLSDLAEMPQATHIETLGFLGLPKIPLPKYPRLNVRRHRRSQAIARLTSMVGPRGGSRWRRSVAVRLNRLNTVRDRAAVPPIFRRQVVVELASQIRQLEGLLHTDLTGWLDHEAKPAT